MSNFLRRTASALRETITRGGSFVVECREYESGNPCDKSPAGRHNPLTGNFANETQAKLAGWWYDQKIGWICPVHNAEFGTQTDLPFALRSLSPDDQREITNYLDIKDDGTNEPIGE